MTLPSADEVRYEIDGLGRRIGRKKGSSHVRWLYGAHGAIAAEIQADAAGVLRPFVYATRSYVPDYVVDFTGATPKTYRLVADHVGSPRLVVDAETGDVVQRVAYDAFGTPSHEAGYPLGWLPFGFAAGLYDPDTGLLRFGAREYDPGVGRWTSKDPIGFAGGDTNLYGYVLGDPVNGIDPSGESALHIVFGGAMGGIVYAATVPIGEFSVEGYLGAWGLGGLGGYLGGVLGRASIGAGARVGAFARAAGPRVAAVATAAANAIKSCGSSDAARRGGGTTTLYRAVSEAEFQQLMRTGRFAQGPELARREVLR